MKKSTTSFLLWDVQQELLSIAAQKHNPEGNVSMFMREVVIPFVAQWAGKPVPRTPVIVSPSKPPGSAQSGTHAIDLAALGRIIAQELKSQANGRA